MLDYVDLWLSVESAYKTLDEIYQQGEAYMKLKEWRLARERFEKAAIEGNKIFNNIYKESNFIKRCRKMSEKCLDEIIKRG